MIGTSKQPNSKALLLAAASALTIAFTTSGAAVAQTNSAQSETVAIDLPSGPLGESMLALGEALGVNIMAEDSLLAGKSAPAISGNLSAQDAIDTILQGSGLTATPNARGDFIVAEAAEEEAVINPILQETDTQDTALEPLIAETIVVQGRFQQSLIDRIPIDPQELPFTLNVLDRDFLDERNFTSPNDALALVPNIDFSVAGFEGVEDSFSVRGYSAGFLINNRLQSNVGRPDDAFVDRYEVLKGPASIAVGPILPGGIINLITKSPEPQPFTTIELSTDQFGTVDAEFDLNAGALGTNRDVLFRLSGSYRDIQFDAEPGQNKSVAIRPSVQVDFAETTSLQASVGYITSELTPSIGFPLNSDGSIPDGFSTDTFFGLESGNVDTDDLFLEGQLTHDFLDQLTLTVRGSYQENSIEYADPTGFFNYTYDDGVAGVGLNNPVVYSYGLQGIFDSENSFADAQLSYDVELWGRRQDFVIGASYNNRSTFINGNFLGVVGPIPIADIGQGPPLIFADRNLDEADNFIAEDSQEISSIYGEMAIRPTEWLSIIGGVRYDEIKTSSQNTFASLSTRDDTNLTFRLGASAEVSKDINLYASYAESFVPQTGAVFGGGAPDPSSGTSYEIGAKGTVFDGAFSFSAAVFTTTRNDIAVEDRENVNTVREGFVTLIGEQRNRGFELEGNWQIADELDLNFAYGYLDVEVVSAAEFVGRESAPPNHTANAFLSYEVKSGPLQGFKLGGGPRYLGERSSLQLPVDYPDVLIGDAFVRYPLTEQLNLSLNVLNITDELYVRNTGGNGTGGAGGQNSFGPPRTFRLTLRAKF